MSLLADAAALARPHLPGSAELHWIGVDRARAGMAELEREVGGVGFVFYSGEHRATVIVIRDHLVVADTHLAEDWSRAPPPAASASICPLRAVWAELRKVGVKDDESVFLVYEDVPLIRDKHVARWNINRKRGPVISFTASACTRID